MKNTDNDILIIFILILGMIFTASLGYFVGKSDMQKEAVKTHNAHYEANDSGDSIFVWNKK